MQQQDNEVEGGEPGTSIGEAEIRGESFQQTRKKKSEAYRGIEGKDSMQPQVSEVGDGELGTSNRETENTEESSKQPRKQKSEAYRVNNKNRRAKNAVQNKGKGKERVDE